MTAIIRIEPRQPSASPPFQPGAPLWRHAPARDREGSPLSDVLLLVPGLRQGGAIRDLVAAQLQAALGEFDDRVVFANLNLALGLAWVTVSAEPGLPGEVAEAIRRRVPDARLVSGQLQRPRTLQLGWAARVRALLA